MFTVYTILTTVVLSLALLSFFRVRNPYHIGEFYKHPDGYKYSANQGFWHIRSVVDTN